MRLLSLFCIFVCVVGLLRLGLLLALLLRMLAFLFGCFCSILSLLLVVALCFSGISQADKFGIFCQ